MDIDTYRRFYTRDWIMPDGTSHMLTSLKSDPARLRGGTSVDISGFFAILGKILKEEDPKIVFAPAYPDIIVKSRDFIPTNDQPTAKLPYTITFKVIRKSSDAIRGRGDPKPMVREQNAAEDTDHVYTTLGQRFYCTVQLDCWAATRFEAELLSEYIENLVQQYTGLMMELGVKLVRFDKRLEDETLRQFYIPGISLQYTVLVERIYYYDTKKIQEIRAKFAI